MAHFHCFCFFPYTILCIYEDWQIKYLNKDISGYGGHGSMESMGVSGMSPLAMMSMHEQYPWMKEKKSSRKQLQGKIYKSTDFDII